MLMRLAVVRLGLLVVTHVFMADAVWSVCECGFLTWSVLCGGRVLSGSVEGSACQGDEILLLLMFLLGLTGGKMLLCITYFTFTRSLVT